MRRIALGLVVAAVVCLAADQAFAQRGRSRSQSQTRSHSYSSSIRVSSGVRVTTVPRVTVPRVQEHRYVDRSQITFELPLRSWPDTRVAPMRTQSVAPPRELYDRGRLSQWAQPTYPHRSPGFSIRITF
jgi:hypothetical protein